LLLAVFWWALSEGVSPLSPGGIIAVAVGTAVSLALIPAKRWRVRWAGLPRLVGFFIRESFLGGVDVARRALDPRLPIAPGFLSYRLRLPHGEQRVMMAWIVSLLPGTVAVALKPDNLELHVIDSRLPMQDTLRELERVVAAAVLATKEPP
jgi:multicomponent Na+:H+ antiporter subunit E